jgi:hypothetical protein
MIKDLDGKILKEKDLKNNLYCPHIREAKTFDK